MNEHLLQSLLPLGIAWARELETRALAEGIPLDAAQLADARACGVQQPERVRVLLLPKLPPPPEGLRAALKPIEPKADARAAGYGILMVRHALAHAASHRRLLAHELAHVAQCERDGGIEIHVERVARALAGHGYGRSPYEREAREVAAGVCGPIVKATGDALFCGLPWREGGRTRAGVDCLGLALLFLSEALGVAPVVDTPPTAEAMHAAVNALEPHLRPERERGEVIFWRHQWPKSAPHVSVHLGAGKFLNIGRVFASRIENGPVLMRRQGYAKLGALPVADAVQLLGRASSEVVLCQLEEVLEPVKADWITLSVEVAREFGLAADEAEDLRRTRGEHRLTQARSALVLLSLELLPVTRVMLAAWLTKAEESFVYRHQRDARALEGSDVLFATRLQALRKDVPPLLKCPFTRKRKRKHDED